MASDDNFQGELTGCCLHFNPYADGGYFGQYSDAKKTKK